jgi:tRNA threonylcarbamoyladenosine biosynthesis protein TsaB
MHYLYLDSSHELAFGIFDVNLRKWIDFKRIEGAQNSKILHYELHKILELHKLKFSQLEAVIINSGPGSYTGMRLTEGLAQILEWQKISVLSFYHFQVPEILDIEDYYWISTAFKGEWFIYSSSDSSKKLIRDAELSNFIDQHQPIYTNYDVKKIGLLETSELIHSNFEKVINYLLQNTLRETVYYFREAEVEFKTVGDK